jgi:hypothetical protein
MTTRGDDLTGIRFGWLEPLRVVARHNLGRRWLCLCKCGRHCQRYAAQLWGALRERKTPMCHTCRYEHASRARWGSRLGNAATRRKRKSFVVLWEQLGTLYNDRATERETDALRREISERLGVPEPIVDDLPALPASCLELGEAIEILELTPQRRDRARKRAWARNRHMLAEQAEARKRAAENEVLRERALAEALRRVRVEAEYRRRHPPPPPPPPGAPPKPFADAQREAIEWVYRATGWRP